MVHAIRQLACLLLAALLCGNAHAGLYDGDAAVVSLTSGNLKKHIQPNTIWYEGLMTDHQEHMQCIWKAPFT